MSRCSVAPLHLISREQVIRSNSKGMWESLMNCSASIQNYSGHNDFVLWSKIDNRFSYSQGSNGSDTAQPQLGERRLCCPCSDFSDSCSRTLVRLISEATSISSLHSSASDLVSPVIHFFVHLLLVLRHPSEPISDLWDSYSKTLRESSTSPMDVEGRWILVYYPFLIIFGVFFNLKVI